MKLRTLARIAVLISLVGLVVSLVTVINTAQSLARDLDEVERLSDIESRVTELGIAVDHLHQIRLSPSVVEGVRGEVEALNRLVSSIDHPAAHPASQHLVEMEYLIRSIASLTQNSDRHPEDMAEMFSLAAVQVSLHRGGLNSALKQVLNDRRDSIDDSLLRAMYTLMFVIVSLAALALIGFVTIHQRIAGPILSLERTIGSLQGGDLGARVPVRHNDELGQLARSLNRMAEVRQIQETDLKASRRELQHSLDRLRALAYHDQLTGVLSRDGFIDQMRQKLIREAGRKGTVVALNIISMRDINETQGYQNGDRLLQAVGERLRRGLRSGSLVARVGGDEFVLFQPPRGAHKLTAEETAAEILALFESPFEIDSDSTRIEMRFGMAEAEEEPQDTLRHAEIALFSVRQHGTRRWQSFDPQMEEETRDRLRLTRNLRLALENEEFELHYQPKVDLHTGRVVACEALLRWRHPESGLQAPGQFIPVAEQSKLIVPIGAWVLREACRQLNEWQDAGLPVVQIAVNVSLVQFLAEDFVVTVLQVLEETGTDPGSLALEITESVFDQDAERLAQQIGRLHASGVELSLDDFGTGYASLRYLREYPFSVIKLDLSFVSRITDDAYSRSICEMVLRIARELDAHVVAEGIETAGQRDILVAMGCPVGQGYYFSRPLEAADFQQLLVSGEALPNRGSEKLQ